MRVTSFVLSAALLLSACAEGPLSGDLLGALASEPPKADPAKPLPRGKALAKAKLEKGGFVVEGPLGYCVDPATVGERSAILASCRILSKGSAGTVVPPVIMAVTFGPRGGDARVPSPEDIAKQAGAPLVGRHESDGLKIAQLGSGGEAGLPKGDPRYWRGAFSHDKRLIGLTLYAPKGSKMAGSDGANLLRLLSQTLIKANPVEESESAGKGLLGGLLQR